MVHGNMVDTEGTMFGDVIDLEVEKNKLRQVLVLMILIQVLISGT